MFIAYHPSFVFSLLAKRVVVYNCILFKQVGLLQAEKKGSRVNLCCRKARTWLIVCVERNWRNVCPHVCNRLCEKLGMSGEKERKKMAIGFILNGLHYLCFLLLLREIELLPSKLKVRKWKPCLKYLFSYSSMLYIIYQNEIKILSNKNVWNQNTWIHLWETDKHSQ